MNWMKTIAAVTLVSASIATPAFAQDVGNAGNVGYGSDGRMQRFYGSYNQMGPSLAPSRYSQEYRNFENFGFTGRDRSRVGGYSPNLNPSGS